jgi:hypothetical protein
MTRFILSIWEFELDADVLLVWPSPRTQLQAMIAGPFAGASLGAILGWQFLNWSNLRPAANSMWAGLPTYAAGLGVLVAALWLWRFISVPLCVIDRRRGVMEQGPRSCPLEQVLFIHLTETINWRSRRTVTVLQVVLLDGPTWTIGTRSLLSGDLSVLGYQLAHFLGVPFHVDRL